MGPARVTAASCTITTQVSPSPSNFAFLARYDARLSKLGASAERLFHIVDQAALDRGQLETQAGFQRLNEVFGGEHERILGDLDETIWDSAG